MTEKIKIKVLMEFTDSTDLTEDLCVDLQKLKEAVHDMVMDNLSSEASCEVLQLEVVSC